MRSFGMLCCAISLAAAPLTARAQDQIGYRGWGPRLGAAFGPDQVEFGAHLDFGHFADHIRLQPNLEVGVGDDLTIVSFNGDLAYRFHSKWGTWSPYVGGGLNINVVNRDRPRWLDDDTDTDLGVSALGGIQKTLMSGDRFFLEMKLGLVDSPDFKFLAGWTFYSGNR